VDQGPVKNVYLQECFLTFMCTESYLTKKEKGQFGFVGLLGINALN